MWIVVMFSAVVIPTGGLLVSTSHVLRRNQKHVRSLLNPTKIWQAATPSADDDADFGDETFRMRDFYRFCTSCGTPAPVTGRSGTPSRYCGNCGLSLLRDSVDVDAAQRVRDGYGDGDGDDNDDDIAPSSMKLSDYVQSIFLPLRREEVSDNTYRIEHGFWTDAGGLLSTVGDVPLCGLGPIHWEAHLRALRERNCATRTQALHRSAYAAALRHAEHVGYVPKGTGEVRKVRARRDRRGRTRDIQPLAAEEVERLLDHASSPMHRAIFGLGVGAGLRPAELCGAHWEDVDFARGMLKVRGTKTTSAWATIPMTDLARREMGRYAIYLLQKKHGVTFTMNGEKATLGHPGDNGIDSNKDNLVQTDIDPFGQDLHTSLRAHLRGLCFAHPRTHQPISSFKKALSSSAKAAGINIDVATGEPRRVFPYLLRHSFATLAATSSPPVPLPVAQKVMRHTSSKMLLDVYAEVGFWNCLNGSYVLVFRNSISYLTSNFSSEPHCGYGLLL